jgi:hypothetical protein
MSRWEILRPIYSSGTLYVPHERIRTELVLLRSTPRGKASDLLLPDNLRAMDNPIYSYQKITLARVGA